MQLGSAAHDDLAVDGITTSRLTATHTTTTSGAAVDELTGTLRCNYNSHDNVYGAVIMTKVIATVHPVHLMNAD